MTTRGTGVLVLNTGSPVSDAARINGAIRARPAAQRRTRRYVAAQSHQAATLGTEAVADKDEALMVRVATGDRRAFNELVRRHAGRLKGLALGFAGGASEADDVVQETFWSLWKSADKWKPDGPPPGAWLTRVAINKAIDSERRRKVRGFFGLEEAPEPVDGAADQERQLAGRRELAEVMGDVRKLPARQRAALLMAAGGEHSNAEIAEALGQSLGAVEQLLVRARRTLRQQLAARTE